MKALREQAWLLRDIDRLRRILTAQKLQAEKITALSNLFDRRR